MSSLLLEPRLLLLFLHCVAGGTTRSGTEADTATMKSFTKAETWPEMSISQKVVWKSFMAPPLPPPPTHQSHRKHRDHPRGHLDSLQSVTGHPWTSPLNSSSPENYETSLKTSTFTEAMTTPVTFTESEISNSFRTIVLEETSGIAIPKGTETVIVEDIIPFTLLAEFAEIADVTSSTLEREGTPINTTALPGTLTIASPITEATMLTSNLIDTFPTVDSTQDIKTTTAVTLPMVYTSLEAGTTTEIPAVAGNTTQPKATGEGTTFTGILTKMTGTKAKTTVLPGTSLTTASSIEGTSALLKTNFFAERSASSSSAEEVLNTTVETLTMTSTMTMALSTTAETPNAAKTFDPTGQTVEKTARTSMGPLSTIYISTTEEAMAPTETSVFTEVPSAVMTFTDDRSTTAKTTPHAEFSDKVYTTTEKTTDSGMNSSQDKTLTSSKRPATVTTIGKHTAIILRGQNTRGDSTDSTQDIKTTTAVTLPMVYTSLEAGTTSPPETPGVAGNNTQPKITGHDGGFLLLRLVVSSPVDLTDHKVAKEFLHKLHQDLQVQLPYTQMSLMKVTRG